MYIAGALGLYILARPLLEISPLKLANHEISESMNGRNKRKYLFWDTPLPKINVEWDGRESRVGKTKHM